MLRDWLPFLKNGFMAFAIPASMIAMSIHYTQQPTQRTRARTLPFESGVSRGQMRPQRFTVGFYLTAMLFIVFDIEIVFLYPLAVQLNALGWLGFVAFAFFVLILLVAYVYIWRKGALEWGESRGRVVALGLWSVVGVAALVVVGFVVVCGVV